MALTVIATAFGGPEVLSVVDEYVSDPGAGQVLIDGRAVGTNPIDHKLYSGERGRDPNSLPVHLGFEAAGVVGAVGADVEGPSGSIVPGDEVIAYPIIGAYATQVLAPAASVLPKPSTVSFEAASGLMLTGTTAVHALEPRRMEYGCSLPAPSPSPRRQPPTER